MLDAGVVFEGMLPSELDLVLGGLVLDVRLVMEVELECRLRPGKLRRSVSLKENRNMRSYNGECIKIGSN